MEVHRNEVMMKKGPWTAEEDEVLINFVKKYGPRDWSSIRSKGLLPRTGKSCRLRWVNKLRPNLKIGCKFSVEEERVVLDLQARFGNKWAAIATYLPGRTDNDVKNFWSTRQKRLARILQSPAQPSKSQKDKGKSMIFHETPTLQVSEFNSTLVKEESTSECQAYSHYCMGNLEMINMVPLPDLMNPNLVNLQTCLPQLEVTETDNKPLTQSPHQFSYPQLQHSKVDLPLLHESHDLVVGLGEPHFSDVFPGRDGSEHENVPQLHFGLPFFGLDGSGQNGRRGDNDILATPDSFFDDFPTDMFDYLEPLPSSSER